MGYKVLIVEDQMMHRQLFEIFVGNSKNYELTASVASADLALPICENKEVDLILMDVMTAMNQNGLKAAKVLKEQYPEIKIIIVTSMPEFTWIDQAKKIGVDSFWYKEDDEQTILSVMDRTMEGEHIYPLDTPVVSIGFSTNHDFTERELQVLKELITGDSNTLIGERLGMGAGTVKWHVKNLLQKTGFHTRTELATEARRLGIVIK